MNEETDEESEEELELTRVRKSKKDTVMGVIANIPILGWILNFFIGFIARKVDEIKRRRRSFKIGLYFQAQMLLGLVGFFLFLIVAVDDLSWLSDTSRVAQDCVLAPSATLLNGTTVPLYDGDGTDVDFDNIYAFVKSWRKAMPCSNEDLHKIDAACTLSQLYVFRAKYIFHSLLL